MINMYNYKEYKKMKEGRNPTCGECKHFISLTGGCKILTILRGLEEHIDACPTKFDSHYEG